MKVLPVALALCISAVLGEEVAEAAQVAEVAETADLAENKDSIIWPPRCPIPPPPPPCPFPVCPIVDCAPPIPCPAIDPFPCPIVDCFQPPIDCACPIVDCFGPLPPLPAPVSTVLQFVRDTPKIDIDYTPRWGRGRPSNYIDNVVFPRVLTDKQYRYRVIKGGEDLGDRAAYPVAADGSQRINLLEWNSGYGIRDTVNIQIYAIDPEGGEYLVAERN